MKTDNDNSVAIAVSLAALLVLGLVLAWRFAKPPLDPALEAALAARYSHIGPISLQSREFTMRASFSLKIEAKDSEQIGKMRNALSNFLQQTLENYDPATLNSPDVAKFTKMQGMLTQAVNEKFPQVKVNQVIITDYVTSAD
ncbi:hypothetical protein V8J88_08135 [Massilia sp. W12]|uniref:hypothetical protein n=1 Tax=Massilia sp. W12 TaxID=3126507 RepID=UPI0030D5DA0C